MSASSTVGRRTGRTLAGDHGDSGMAARDRLRPRAQPAPPSGARFKAKNKGACGPAWFNKPRVTVAEPTREFAFNRSGFAIGSYTWRTSSRSRPTAVGG